MHHILLKNMRATQTPTLLFNVRRLNLKPLTKTMVWWITACCMSYRNCNPTQCGCPIHCMVDTTEEAKNNFKCCTEAWIVNPGATGAGCNPSSRTRSGLELCGDSKQCREKCRLEIDQPMWFVAGEVWFGMEWDRSGLLWWWWWSWSEVRTAEVAS